MRTSDVQSRGGSSIRPSDVVLALVLSALGAYLMVENIVAVDDSTRVDSHSWWLVPVFLAATAPVLWWRRGPAVVTAVAVAAMAVHVLAFGSLVRCGAGLPLCFVLAFLVGVRDEVRRSLVGLVLVQALGALVLVRDTAAGVEILPVVAIICLGIWGIGRLARHRAHLAQELRERNVELARLRDARADLDVSGDRARLSAELDHLLDERLEQLSHAAASATTGDLSAARVALETIEADSRQVLERMREVVGVLRGGEVALSPAPSVAHLDALLARGTHADSRVQVVGDPRGLPASVELSAYRVVEHVLGFLADEPSAPVEVTMGFADGALELAVSGRVAKGADVRAAVERARERVRLQHGRLDVKIGRGRARVVAHMPVVPV